MDWLVMWISIIQTRKDLATSSAPKVALSSFISASGSPTGISSRFSSTPSNSSRFNHQKPELLKTISTLSPFLKTPVEVCKSVFCPISAISTADGDAAAEYAKGLLTSSCWSSPSDLRRPPKFTPCGGDPVGRMISRPPT